MKGYVHRMRRERILSLSKKDSAIEYSKNRIATDPGWYKHMHPVQVLRHTTIDVGTTKRKRMREMRLNCESFTSLKEKKANPTVSYLIILVILPLF